MPGLDPDTEAAQETPYMIRKFGRLLSYIISIGYVFLLAMPLLYCLQHGCNGPEGDGFMPAFFLTPLAGITTAFSLQNSIQQIRKSGSWSWIFWPLAIIFALVLAGMVIFIAMGVYTLNRHH